MVAAGPAGRRRSIAPWGRVGTGAIPSDRNRPEAAKRKARRSGPSNGSPWAQAVTPLAASAYSSIWSKFMYL